MRGYLMNCGAQFGSYVRGPAVLRNFVWKVCSDVLPTKEKLACRHISEDPLCPICCQENESIVHILWKCPASVAVWQEGSRRIQKLYLNEGDGMDFFSQLKEKLGEGDLTLALTVARRIRMRMKDIDKWGTFYFPE
jgi:hypothetical protein